MMKERGLGVGGGEGGEIRHASNWKGRKISIVYDREATIGTKIANFHQVRTNVFLTKC